MIHLALIKGLSIFILPIVVDKFILDKEWSLELLLVDVIVITRITKSVISDSGPLSVKHTPYEKESGLGIGPIIILSVSTVDFLILDFLVI